MIIESTWIQLRITQKPDGLLLGECLLRGRVIATIEPMEPCGEVEIVRAASKVLDAVTKAKPHFLEEMQ